MSRVADPLAKVTLLRAAEEVFAERGLAGAKVEEIARRAALSKGAFYLHFDSKEAALKQVVESFLARCGALFASPSSYPDLPEEPLDALDFWIEVDIQVFEFLWQNKAILRILDTCGGQYDYLVLAFRAEIAQRTREWVDHWRSVDLFRHDVDAELAAVLMGGAYHELAMKMKTSIDGDRRPPLEQWLEFAQETFARAFGTAAMVAAIEVRNRRVSTGAPARHPTQQTRTARTARAGRGRV